MTAGRVGGPDLTDVEVARTLATDAGELLVNIRATPGCEGVDLGRTGDVRANELLLRGFAKLRPADSVLSEESADDRSRLHAQRVWIIDPLDGTREYSQAGRDDWAVHVALWERGGGLTVGAVALPALGVTYDSASAPVSPIAGGVTPPGGRPQVVVSGSRPPVFASAVAHAIGGEIMSMGSAGAKAMAVVRGEAAAYVHAGGQYEWDSAAPVAVSAAQGLWCSRIDGSPLNYNQPDVYLPDLVICQPELSMVVLEAISSYE